MSPWHSDSMSQESQVSWAVLCMTMRKRNCNSVTDKGGVEAVLVSSKKSTKHGITNGDSPSVEITWPCCRRRCFCERAATVWWEKGGSSLRRRRPCLSCETWPKPTFLGCCRGWGGARSLPWLLRAGHSGLELVGARAAKTSRGASNTRWAKRRRHAAATLLTEKCVCVQGVTSDRDGGEAETGEAAFQGAAESQLAELWQFPANRSGWASVKCKRGNCFNSVWT